MSEREQPLAGLRIAITRERGGLLAERLGALGAEVVHLPLIEVVDAEEVRPADLVGCSWLVVTSRHGARRAGPAAASAAGVKLAAVGVATGEELAAVAGRPVDLVPAVRRGDALVAAFPAGTGRVLLAQADLAPPTVADGLRAKGWDVDVRIAYRTVVREPSQLELETVAGVDAVLLASGSAAQAWARHVGPDVAAEVLVIGPTTADVAVQEGLKVTAVAADHSIGGLLGLTVELLAGHS